MTATRTQPELTGIELVLLARASGTTKPTRNELIQAAVDLRPPDEPPKQAKAAASSALAQLHQRRWLTELPSKRCEITPQGTDVLRQTFAVSSVPSWPTLRDHYMPALGIGMKPGADSTKKALRTSDSIAMTILNAGGPPARSVTELCNTLLIRALGLSNKPSTMFELRAHILARHLGVPTKQLPRDKRAFHRFVNKTVASELQIRKTGTLSQLRSALSRRWLYRKSPAAPALGDAVDRVLPKVSAAGRFGREKVFISALWHDVIRQRGLSGLSLDDFKRWLVDANREQVLDLVRADLVGAMDPRLVADSEIEDMGATFHFVVDRRAHNQREV